MTDFLFNGRRITQPGVYTEVKSGINNAPLALPFGNVLVIDKDDTSFHGNGAGIAGEASEGKQAFYTFQTITSFREFIGGGLFYDLAQPLFRPFGSGNSGVSTLYYVRALTTVGATLSLAFDAGTIVFKALNEGISGNGVITNGRLTRGYSIRLQAGVSDANKFIFKFYRGTFKGNDPATGRAYDDIIEADSAPEIIAQSPEVATIEEFMQWALGEGTFVNNFSITTGANVTGAIIVGDLTSFTTDQLFTGGASTYNTARINEVLAAIKDANINYILSTDKGLDAISIDNFKIATFLDTEMIDPATLVVPAGNTSGVFESQSIAAAQAYNSQNVVVVHGGVQVIDIRANTGLRDKDVLYNAALFTGRKTGLPPQTPATYKGVDIAGVLHDLTSDEKDTAIRNGVLVVGYSPEL